MSPQEAFHGKTAVITGAASGIGEGIARTAATLGMNVVLADIARDRLDAVVRDIQANGGTALGVVTDVGKVADLERLADAAYDRFGEMTLAINNAGIEMIGYCWEIDDAIWDKAVDINIRAVIHGTRIFAKRMIDAGTRGYISNVSSIGGLGIMPTQTPYIMSKHAVLSFTECVYLEMQVAQLPIHVSAIVPAAVKTRIFDDAPSDRSSIFVEGQRQKMAQSLAEGGMDIDEAGKIILDGIAARNFWVSTHPETTEQFAKARADYLSRLATPALTDETRYLLGK